MSKRKSRSGPCRVIRRHDPEPLTPEAEANRALARIAYRAAQEDEKNAYEQKLNLEGRRRQ